MKLSRNIARLLVEKKVTLDEVVSMLRGYKMLGVLPSVEKAVKEIHEGENDKSTMKIESPFPLSDDAIATIKRIVGNDIASHEVTINEALLAGFKVRFKEQLYDGSAERITKQLLATSTN
jgi:F0F1-type ATP synthase delta subunit